jgi:probable F420-dependent oxidoreductase
VEPQLTIGVSCFATPRSIGPLELAQAAEERGFSHMFLGEHTHIPAGEREGQHLFGGPIPDTYRSMWDPFVALAFAAAGTSRIRLGTGVALPALRDVLVLSKEIATLDVLSGGRFCFGVGFGWHRHEVEDHGIRYSERRDVTKDRIAALCTFWQDGSVQSFHGSHTEVGEFYAEPKPAQRPRPPILMGGEGGQRLLDAVAEYCDGWLALSTRGLPEKLLALDRRLEARGRSRKELEILVYLWPHQTGRLEELARLGVDGVVFDVPSAPASQVLPVLDGLAKNWLHRF